MLAAAARNAPANARYVYVYAVALNDAGQTKAAIQTLESSLKTHPYDRDSLSALVTFLEQSGDFAKALTYAKRLDELEPGNPEVHRVLEGLNQPQNRR
jgi:Flp pilus assembly protein TadD